MNDDGINLQRMLTKLEQCGFEVNFGHNSNINTWIGMIYCKNNGQRSS